MVTLRFVTVTVTTEMLLGFGLALLLNRDPAKADAILAKFDRMAKKYPYESDIASERELIQAAQEKHAQNKT